MFQFMYTADAARRADAAESKAQDARVAAQSAREELNELRGQVDRLQMICEAMWTLLKQQSGAEDAELAELVQEIDLRDGKLDGRSKPAPTPCSRCGRAISVRTHVCIYCGEQNATNRVF